MSDILDQAYDIMQCKDCPWYKTCIMPMRLSAEDMRRQISQNPNPAFNAEENNTEMQELISSMASAAQNSLLEGCPILIKRLRSNPKLAQKIKQIMQNWSQEED